MISFGPLWLIPIESGDSLFGAQRNIADQGLDCADVRRQHTVRIDKQVIQSNRNVSQFEGAIRAVHVAIEHAIGIPREPKAEAGPGESHLRSSAVAPFEGN